MSNKFQPSLLDIILAFWDWLRAMKK
jgi:hypothetical protein